VVAGAAAVCFASAYGAASLKQQHPGHHARAVQVARTHTVPAPVVQGVSLGAAQLPGLRVKRPPHPLAATTTAAAPAVHAVAAAARVHPLTSVPASAPRRVTPAPVPAPTTPTPAPTPAPPASTPAPTRTTAPAPSQEPAASSQPSVNFFDGG